VRLSRLPFMGRGLELVLGGYWRRAAFMPPSVG